MGPARSTRVLITLFGQPRRAGNGVEPRLNQGNHLSLRRRPVMCCELCLLLCAADIKRDFMDAFTEQRVELSSSRRYFSSMGAYN